MLQSLKETIKMRKFNWHIVHADIATGTRYSHIPSQDHLYLEKKKSEKATLFGRRHTFYGKRVA